MPTSTRKLVAPQNAFDLRLPDHCEFGKPVSGGSERDENFVSKAPIDMVAVSGEPFSHWYWGRVVIDAAGVKLTRDRLAVDWCHESDEILGWAAPIKAKNQLRLKGELISTSLNDRAHGIMRLGTEGVPYEASVQFDPRNGLRIEEYGDGTVAAVNGQSIPGPLTVIRECLLRGVAVCPHGADLHTASEFSADSGQAAEVEISVFTERTVMSTDIKAADQAITDLAADKNDVKPAELTAPTPDPSPTDKADWKARVTDYVTRFGADLGAKWAIEEKPLVDAYAEFTEQITTEHSAAVAALEGKLAAAEDKLRQVGSLAGGEQNPVSSDPQDDPVRLAADKKVAELTAKGTSPGAAKFAASMRLDRTRVKKID